MNGKIHLMLFGLGVVGRGVVEQLYSVVSMDVDIQLTVVDRGKDLSGRAIKAAFIQQFFKDTEIQWLTMGSQEARNFLYNLTLPRDKVNIMIECTGYSDLRDLYLFCHRSHIPVITSNKTFLVNNLDIIDSFASSGIPLMIEATVGGGMPVIKLLRDNFSRDRIRFIAGILNGTTNYILSLLESGKSFNFSIDKARDRGLAEPKSEAYREGDDSDLNGKDLYYKLIILSRLIWGTKPRVIDHSHHGNSLHNVRRCDIRYACQRLKQAIKFVGVIRQLRTSDNEYDLFFTPALLSASHGFAGVNHETNVLLISSDFAGTTVSIGPGAGPSPTANAIMSDLGVLLDEINVHGKLAGQRKSCCGSVVEPSDREDEFRDFLELEFPGYYVRFVVRDSIGIIQEISKHLSSQGLDIKEVLQLDHSREELKEVIEDSRYEDSLFSYLIFAIILGTSTLGKVKKAIKEIEEDYTMHSPSDDDKNLFLIREPVIIPFIDIPPVVGYQKWGNIHSLTQEAASVTNCLKAKDEKISVDLFPERYLDPKEYQQSLNLLEHEIKAIGKKARVRRILVFNDNCPQEVFDKVLDLHKNQGIEARFFKGLDDKLIDEIKRWEDGLLEDFVVFPSEELVIIELAKHANGATEALDSGYERYGEDHIGPYLRKFEKLWDYAQQ